MSLLVNTKYNIIETGKSGIYRTQCKDYDKCYIGQTKRNISKRFKKYIKSIKNQEIDKSPF